MISWRSPEKKQRQTRFNDSLERSHWIVRLALLAVPMMLFGIIVLLLVSMEILMHPFRSFLMALTFTYLFGDVLYYFKKLGTNSPWFADPIIAQAWVILATAILWFLYTGYEIFMVSARDNIRVDLFYLHVPLYASIFVGLVAWTVIRLVVMRRLAKR